jgi:hypothetical protein
MNQFNLKQLIEDKFGIKFINDNTTSDPRRIYDFNIDEHIVIWLSLQGYLEVIKYLHDDLELNLDYQTILNIACEYGYLDIVKYLHHILDSNITDYVRDDYIILTYACSKGYLDIIKYLHENNIVNTDKYYTVNSPLKRACNNGHLHIVKYIYEVLGIGIEVFRNHKSLLILSCMSGNLELVKYLHEVVGLNITDFRCRNCKSLFVAKEANYKDIIKYLHEVVGLDDKDSALCEVNKNMYNRCWSSDGGPPDYE